MRHYIGEIINGVEIVGKTPGSGKVFAKYLLLCLTCKREYFVGARDVHNITRAKKAPCPLCRKDRMDSEGVTTPEGNMYSKYKAAAQYRKLDFDLSLVEFSKLLSNTCFYCGGEGIPRNNRKGDLTRTYCGLDRVNSSKGYTLDNCVSCCYDCNKAKSNMEQEKFYVWINRLINFNEGMKWKS